MQNYMSISMIDILADTWKQVPHKFDCQAIWMNKVSSDTERLTSSKRQRKELVHKWKNNLKNTAMQFLLDYSIMKRCLRLYNLKCTVLQLYCFTFIVCIRICFVFHSHFTELNNQSSLIWSQVHTRDVLWRLFQICDSHITATLSLS